MPGVRDTHLELIEAMSAKFDGSAGAYVPVKATGAIGAVMSDVGFSWRLVRGLGLVASTAFGRAPPEGDRGRGHLVRGAARRGRPARCDSHRDRVPHALRGWKARARRQCVGRPDRCGSTVLSV